MPSFSNPFQRRYSDPYGGESFSEKFRNRMRSNVDASGILTKIGLSAPKVQTSGPKWYRYSAIAANGSRHKGKMQGPTTQSISDALQADGWIPLEITEINSGGLNTDLGALMGGDQIRFSLPELATFSRQVAELLKAGVPLARALSSLGEDQEPKLARICAELSSQVSSGVNFSEALTIFPTVFDEVFRSYIQAGEQSGTLPETMARLAKTVEKRAQMQQKIKGVTAYPKFVGMAIGGIVGGIITFLVPMYGKIYESFGAKLPTPTLVLLTVSNNVSPVTFTKSVPMPWFLATGNTLTLGGLLGRIFGFIGIFMFFELLRVRRGKKRSPIKLFMRIVFALFLTFFAHSYKVNIFSTTMWGTIIVLYIGIGLYADAKADDPRIAKRFDTLKFRMPLFGKISMLDALFRWSSTLSGALSSGVSMTSALELAAATTGSRWHKLVAKELTTAIRSGKPLSEGLSDNSDLYPASVRAMVATGEQTGDLATMMESVSSSIDAETDALVAGLAAKVEVALLLVMGVVVGGLLLVLYLPILNLASAGFSNV